MLTCMVCTIFISLAVLSSCLPVSWITLLASCTFLFIFIASVFTRRSSSTASMKPLQRVHNTYSHVTSSESDPKCPSCDTLHSLQHTLHASLTGNTHHQHENIHAAHWRASHPSCKLAPVYISREHTYLALKGCQPFFLHQWVCGAPGGSPVVFVTHPLNWFFVGLYPCFDTAHEVTLSFMSVIQWPNNRVTRCNTMQLPYRHTWNPTKEALREHNVE